MYRFCAIFVFYLLICLPGQALGDSRKCLEAVQEAIDNGDAAAFERLVDVKGIASDGLDSFLEEASKPGIAESLPPLAALMISGIKSSGAQFLRGTIINEASAFTHNGIASGAFGGKPGKPLETQGMLASLFANASLGRKEIRAIGPEYNGENGPERSFLIHDWGNGNDYPVTASFSQGDGFCLVKVRNFPEIFALLIAEATQ